MNDFLFQVLIDLADINALTAVYISIYIGMTIKLLWAWNVECSFFVNISDTGSTKIIHPSFFYTKKSHYHVNTILMWIIKYIRRKKSSQDDPEHSPPYFYF